MTPTFYSIFTCRKILRTVASKPLLRTMSAVSGTPTTDSDFLPTKPEKGLFDDDDLQKLLLIRSSFNNRLKEEKLSAKAEEIPAAPMDPENTLEIPELLKKLQLQTSSDSRKRLTLETLQVGQILIKSIFEKDESIDSKISKQFEVLIQTQCMLSTKILKSQKELSHLQDEVDKVKYDNHGTMTQNRELMMSLETTNDHLQEIVDSFNAKSQESKILEELSSINRQNDVFRYILQNLIIGSGINWAKDPDLQETMLRVGEDIGL